MTKLIELIFDRISQLLEESRTYRVEKRLCKNCEKFVHLLEVEKREKKDLLEKLLAKPNEKEDESEKEVEFKPVLPANWRQKRIQLERESRELAQQRINDLKEEYNELKSEL